MCLVPHKVMDDMLSASDVVEEYLYRPLDAQTVLQIRDRLLQLSDKGATFKESVIRLGSSWIEYIILLPECDIYRRVG